MNAEQQGDEAGELAAELAHATLRGVIGSMAMTGMRSVTVSLGVVKEPPPSAIARRKSRYPVMLRRRRQPHHSVTSELLHWGVGAAGGVGFRLLPRAVRRRAWSGPLYGMAVWLGFELVGVPALGIPRRRGLRLGERAALIADHLLYGLVLTETRSRSRD